MHGSSPGISLFPSNAEVESVATVVDTKPSPRRAAIEKAQTELRRQNEAREERKRELEFLEKGGNPLDFKSGRSASVSLNSTSSEAKGSLVRANSVCGDSVESCGRPRGSAGREPDSADNLLLFDKLSGENNAKHMCKRAKAVPLEHTKVKEMSHGVKSQAYARRNRSRTARDGHGSKSVILPSLPEAQADIHAASSVYNSKPLSPNFSTDNHKDTQIDHTSTVNVSEIVRDVDHSNKHIDAAAGQLSDGTEAMSVGLLLVPLELPEISKEISRDERNNGMGVPVKDVKNAHDSDLSKKADVCHDDKVDDIVAITDDDKSSTVKRVESSSNEDAKKLSIVQGATENNNAREKSRSTPIIDECRSNRPNVKKSIVRIKNDVELSVNIKEMSNGIGPLSKNESAEPNCEVASESERKQCNSLGDRSHSINKAGAITSTLTLPTCEPKRGATTTSSVQYCAEKLAKKAREDAILKEARTIEVNLKRAGELPTCYISLEKSMKCHWDFVIEEMAWMANDFMQERLWKMSVAARICHQVAYASQKKYEQKIICQKQRNVARTIAISVMNFWHSAEVSRTNMDTYSGANGELTSDLSKSSKVNGTEAERDQDSKYMEANKLCLRPAIQAYAVRFLEFDNDTFDHPVLAQGPTTPDRIHDEGVVDMSWEDQLSEESLFYTVPPGAMQAYREAVEPQWVKHKRMGNSRPPEDCDASICDYIPDGPPAYVYEEEEEGETGSYFLPGTFEGSLSSKFTHERKKKSHPKACAARLHDGSNNLSYDPYLEDTSADQGLVFVGKRPSSSLNVCSVPTKRVRTAGRPRIVSSFSAGVSGSLQVTSKTDASSGDTNSFQDDQSSMHAGSQVQKNMEVESKVDFEKHLPSDGIEISVKAKQKKSKHGEHTINITDSGVLVVSGKGSLLDQRLQVDFVAQHEQRDNVKKRLEGQHFESNGNIGIYGQHVAKKPKHSKQLTETSPDVFMPVTGCMPSPVASQMSNMSNQNKFIKITANRDRGRKNKAMKMAVGQSGSGIPWTSFEDQALVVLVHDTGPNWELVSDAINSILQFKCIFRKPKDCKERHKYLMDKSAGDGADSAEDSGSSQPYPSTLLGIPKATERKSLPHQAPEEGSARQLFQRLQGPIEEDVLKTHFEKIILIGQQLHSRRSQNVKQEQKQIVPVHSSHLSQTCPNGSVLTPLDLCDSITSSSDILTLGNQGSYATGAAIQSQQGFISPVLSTSGLNNGLQGSSGIVLSSNLPSPSTPVNVPARDAQRYCISQTTSLPVNDQQMQYSQMLSGRNVQQSNISAHAALPVGVDRGVRMSSGTNGVGMMSGRTMHMPRPGYQGPSGMLNMVSSGSMLTGSGVKMPNSVNVHPNAVHGPVNPMMRPRDALQMLRPRQTTEDHRQMMMQDLQMQVSQGSVQSLPPFNGISNPFSTATGLPSVQSYPAQQHQQSHQPQQPQQPHMLGNPHHPQMQGTNQSSAHQHAYAMRFAKDRQQQHQQRMLPQPQHPYISSSSMSHMPQPPQTQPSPSVTPTPLQAQHNKQHTQPSMQASSGLSNPMMKPKQRPQAQQQQPRPHQQKPLQQHQAKHMKGLGRGTVMTLQNVLVDPSQTSGLPVGTSNQVPEKPVMQQGLGFFSGKPGLNPTLTQSSNQNKMFCRPPAHPSKQMSPFPSSPDTCNQGPLQASTNHALSDPYQLPLPTSMPLANPLQQHHVNQNVQRTILQHNHPLTTDGKIHTSADPVHVSQMVPVPAPPLPRCAESASSASVASPASHWKPEPQYETSTATLTVHLAASPKENLVGTETSISPSNDQLGHQRQLGGSVLPDGHGVGGQRRQQKQSQQEQLLQQEQQSQHSQTAQGSSFARPSNPGTE